MRPHRSITTASAALALLLGSCASTGGSDDGKAVSTLDQIDGSKIRVESQTTDANIGYVLTSLDRRIRAWIKGVSEANSPQDRDRVLSLEENIRRETIENEEAIADQLLAGPPSNRRVAAAALGFSGSRESLSTLLAALTDTDELVVANALLSIAQLGDPDTPVESIATLARDGESPEVRNNATRALRAIAVHGLDLEERSLVRETARAALYDESAPVRVTSLILLVDIRAFDSIDAVSGLLGDPVPLVARAASAATAKMGELEPEVKGKAARALTAALLKVDEARVRPAVMRNLQQLSGKNYGDDTDEWIAWANRMP